MSELNYDVFYIIYVDILNNIISIKLYYEFNIYSYCNH